MVFRWPRPVRASSNQCEIAPRRGLCAALALSFLATGAAAQDFKEKYDRFGLFAGCEPMWLVVEYLDDNAARVGLTEEALRAAAESRLRAARLYSAEADQYLYIAVTVARRAFYASVEYRKQLPDPLSGERMPATTWKTAGVGTHGDDSGYILSNISQYLDQFLVEFLRVNEEACGKR